MSATIKKIHHELELRKNGIEITVRDSNGKQLGNLCVHKSGVTWCKGKTTVPYGKPITWKQFIRWAEGST